MFSRSTVPNEDEGAAWASNAGTFVPLKSAGVDVIVDDSLKRYRSVWIPSQGNCPPVFGTFDCRWSIHLSYLKILEEEQREMQGPC
jgi:hypothetical protein